MITLTDKAASHISSQLQTRGYGLGIRVRLRASGCSGLAYVLEYVDELNSDDIVFDDHGVKLIVDAKTLLYIDGSELAWEQKGINEGLKFNNPNVKAECGCGESFNV